MAPGFGRGLGGRRNAARDRATLTVPRSPARSARRRGRPRTGAGARRGGRRSSADSAALRVEVHERVPAAGDRLHPLRVGAQGHARHAGQVGLLLDAARVRQHGPRVGQQRSELQIAERLGQREAVHVAQPLDQAARLQPLAGARVHREQHPARAAPPPARPAAPAAREGRRCRPGGRSAAGSPPAPGRGPSSAATLGPGALLPAQGRRPPSRRPPPRSGPRPTRPGGSPRPPRSSTAAARRGGR